MGPLTLLLVLVVAIILAITTLRRTRDVPHPMSANDSRSRALALFVLVMLVAGFGLCGGAGFALGVVGFLAVDGADGYAMLTLVPGLIGLIIAGAGAWVLRKFRRSGTGSMASDSVSDRASDKRAEP